MQIVIIEQWNQKLSDLALRGRFQIYNTIWNFLGNNRHHTVVMKHIISNL